MRTLASAAALRRVTALASQKVPGGSWTGARGIPRVVCASLAVPRDVGAGHACAAVERASNNLPVVARGRWQSPQESRGTGRREIPGSGCSGGTLAWHLCRQRAWCLGACLS
jgi:hypothetical protein